MMYKLILALIVLTTIIFSDPIPPPWAKEGAKKDTVAEQRKPLPPPFAKAAAREVDTTFIIVSNEDTTIKEYYITDPSDRRNEKPPIKIIQNGTILSITLNTRNVGSSGALRDKDNNLVWKATVPKSQQLEINTSDWIPGKYYGGIFNYKFGIIKK